MPNIKNIIILVIFNLSIGSSIHPPDGSTLSYIHVKFQWESIDTTLSYQFELSNSNNFNSNILSLVNNKGYYIDKDNIDWETNYYWRVRPINGDWNEYSFSTGSPSYVFASSDIEPVEILKNNYSDENLDGLTIYGVMDPFFSAAVDMNGKEVWNSGGIDSYMFMLVDDKFNILGNANLPPSYNGELGIEFSIENGIQWSQPTYGDEVDFLQHEIIKLPNGNYMGFVITYKEHFVPNSDDYSQIPDGFDFSFEDNIPGWDGSFSYPWTWKGERIVEWDIDGNEVWSWNPFDYYSLDDFDYMSEFWEFASQNQDDFDWTHFNALVYDEIENAIYVSSKNLSRITKIDKSSGNIVWNMGKQWLGDNVIQPDRLFSGQHGLQLLENGNLVFFDNGVLSGRFDGSGESKSTALEIKVDFINGEYISNTVWSYTLDKSLYGVVSGNVHKLGNDNYLITTVGSVDGAHSIEVTSSGEIVWDCKYNIGTPQGAIYRAMRISGLYDSSIFNNQPILAINNYIKPEVFLLNSIYPNPFNPIINIEYELLEASNLQLAINNIKGKNIEIINLGHKLPGNHVQTWDGSEYSSGVYFVSINNKINIQTKKVILLK